MGMQPISAMREGNRLGERCKFILGPVYPLLSFFDLNELLSVHPRPSSLHLFSFSEPHNEEQDIDFRRLYNPDYCAIAVHLFR
jgi:hypothetical protein